MAGHLPGRRFESLPESFFLVLISHLSFSMTLARLRSDCQVWSMFTAEPLPLRVHHTSTHTHKHTQCIHTFPVPIVQCLSPIILLESNYVPLAPLWCYRQHRIVLYALLHKASVLLLSSSHESYDDKHGFLFSPRNTLFTQPYPTIMKHLPSNH